jgi:GH24 family phage-related lysozyme (muramidase)
MSNRFLEKKAYLEGLSTPTARAQSSTLIRAASQGKQVTSVASRNRFGFSGPMSTDERALVVLMENRGIDLGVGTLIDHLLDQVPGSSVIPQSARDALVRYVDERIRSATDNLLENAELVLNRYSAAAPQYYGSVQVLRNGRALYSTLKDALIQLTEANKFIDLFVLTHGSRDYIALEGSDYIDGNRIREIKTVHNGGRPVQLRSVYMMNCVGSTLNQAWIDIGAKVSAGSIRNNYIPEPTMYYFFNNWKEDKSFNDSVLDAYRRTIDTIESIITTGLRVAIPGTNLIPGFDRLVESIADIENRQFIQDSAPVITGDGSVKISSDTLSFGQSVTTRSFAFVPMSRSRGRASLPRAMQAPERVMSYQVSQQAIEFIKSFEAFRTNLYNDPAGHCSIGYGHLVHRGNCDGRASESEFTGGVTESRATEMLRTHLTGVEAVVNEAVEVHLNQHQFDALVSFAYNVGTGRRGTASQEGSGFLGSALLRRLNSGDYDAVPSELARWNRAGGRVLPGLTRRRTAEGRMFSSGDYSTGQSRGLELANSVTGDPVADAALETEGAEHPDTSMAAAAMQVTLPAHCPVNAADDANSAHFTLAEFASSDGADTPRGAIGNVQTLMNQLEVLRAELGGNPITIISGYRSPSHNTSVGGAARSQHLCGRAADIRVRGYTPAQVHAKIEELIAAGRMVQGGLGIYNTFVHYDIRGTRARWDERSGGGS